MADPATAKPQQPQSDVNTRPILVRKDWLTVSVLAFLVALLWIGFGIYTLLNTTTIPEAQKKRLTLFSPDLDDGVISELEEKKQVLGQQLDENARVILFLSGEHIETSSSP